MSHPARGAWVKIFVLIYKALSAQSHPRMGAWVKIYCGGSLKLLSHPRMGAWVKIYKENIINFNKLLRPLRVYGLKFNCGAKISLVTMSRPSRGVWVKIKRLWSVS